jgi:hypothetical protein
MLMRWMRFRAIYVFPASRLCDLPAAPTAVLWPHTSLLHLAASFDLVGDMTYCFMVNF